MAKLIKSKTRVKKYGEVFTPDFIVRQMCDMLPDDAWSDIDKTFLEPSCGNGNFLVEILARKLKMASDERDVLRCYRSIYGIDIQEDNVKEARGRMFDMAPEWVSDNGLLVISITLRQNIVVGDSLKIMKRLETAPDFQSALKE